MGTKIIISKDEYDELVGYKKLVNEKESFGVWMPDYVGGYYTKLVALDTVPESSIVRELEKAQRQLNNIKHQFLHANWHGRAGWSALRKNYKDFNGW